MKRLLIAALSALYQFGLASLLGCHPCSLAMAQELTVSDCRLLPNDSSAVKNAVNDNNGRLCGLVKIFADGTTNLHFPKENEYIGKVEYKANESTYYVHIPDMLSKISFSHDNYLPGEINLKDFGYKVKSGKTYLVTLTAPSAVSRNNRTITFRINPAAEGALAYGDRIVEIPSDGIVEIEHNEKPFSYVVTSPNFKSFKGNIPAGAASMAHSISLQPLTTNVTVKCNRTNSARVFVDNVYYGKVGTLSIPLGRHNIRVACSGYIDDSRDVNITDRTSELSFQISKNRGQQIDIHATPVKIIANTKHIYKNNKRVKEWKYSGNEIRLMPGKYLLTTKSNKRNFVEIGTKPMVITFRKGRVISCTEAGAGD